MRLQPRLAALAGLSVFFATVTPAFSAGSPQGIWLNDTGRGAIEVKPCGSGVCGHVVWLRDETDVKGCGRQIIGEAKPAGSGLWDNGWIYSPEKKRRYDVELKPLSDGNLRVKGYAGTKLFSKTMIWKPAPADLKRCDGDQVAKTDTAPVAAPALEIKDAAKPVASIELKDAAKPAEAKPDDGKPSATVSNAPVAVPAPVPATRPAGTADQQAKAEEAAPAAKPETDVAEDDTSGSDEKEGIDLGGLIDKMKEIEKETGYGIKKVAEGRCRIKVPFATINVKCENID